SIVARSSFLTRLYHSHPCECPGTILPPPSMGSYQLHPCNRTAYILIGVLYKTTFFLSLMICRVKISGASLAWLIKGFRD
ncbi:MAG: hypothetical protein KAJ03_02765, partial [Gammaproteobacteria bacterium]|nr:hypothetical protein [Gammaproteobacteria bacterium]